MDRDGNDYLVVFLGDHHGVFEFRWRWTMLEHKWIEDTSAVSRMEL